MARRVSDGAGGFRMIEPDASTEAVYARAELALGTNADFLALVNPSNAQTLNQVRALTRQCNGLIRLLLGALDDTTGT